MKTFDIEIVRNVSTSLMSWPEPGAAGVENNLGGNRSYTDLRRLPWREARRVFELESQLIDRLAKSADPDNELYEIENELWDEIDGDLYGLDIGVASSVVALSAARCIPFSSCNAGALGGHHAESHPLVAFFTRKQALPLLLDCAENAGVGLENTSNGGLIVYGVAIEAMRLFARKLMQESAAFRSLKIPRAQQRTVRSMDTGRQPRLI